MSIVYEDPGFTYRLCCANVNKYVRLALLRFIKPSTVKIMIDSNKIDDDFNTDFMILNTDFTRARSLHNFLMNCLSQLIYLFSYR